MKTKLTGVVMLFIVTESLAPHSCRVTMVTLSHDITPVKSILNIIYLVKRLVTDFLPVLYCNRNVV
jgi:hypothetical protein